MLEIKEITEKKIWEDFLAKIDTENFPFFQTWNWGEVQKHSRFPITRLGIFDDAQLVGVTLVVDVVAKRGHYLHVRHGPVLRDFQKYFDSVLAYMKALAKKKKAAFIRMSPLIRKEAIAPQFFMKRKLRSAPIHNMDAEICSILSLKKTEQELLSAMRKSHRYLIKKAKTMPIEIIKSKQKNDIEMFLHLYNDFSTQKHFIAHRGIIEEFEVLRQDDQVLLFLAKYEGKIIAGILVDFVGPIAVYHHAASNALYKQIPANYLLLWQAILEAKVRGKSFFNLWGIAPSEDKNHPWSGFTLFKTGFGGERVEFVHAMDIPVSRLYWRTFFIDWVTKKRKGY